MTGPTPIAPRSVLVVDVGGSHVKCLVSGATFDRYFDSGPGMDPPHMVDRVLEITSDWRYDVVSIGYPGPVRGGQPSQDPHNLAPGWVGFDFEAAFDRSVRIINDAAMQALGSYHGGRMLFLGFGTGLGAALIVEGAIQPLELAHLPWRDGRTYEDLTGDAALRSDGRETWLERVGEVLDLFRQAFQVDYIVVGGGNARHLKDLPPGIERGENDNAFRGGFLLWEQNLPLP